MDAPLDPRLRTNPFATRFTRPGALPFLLPSDVTPQALVARLASHQWRGEIIGPHGSGKSTLLATLLPLLAAEGRHVVHVALSQGERKLPPEATAGSWTADTQVVVDGYEQLSWWHRRRLLARCRRAGCGLLVTAHEPCGLPPLFQTEPSLPVAQSVVRELMAGHDGAIRPEDVEEAYRQRPGDIREMLFRLYDLYQSRQG